MPKPNIRLTGYRPMVNATISPTTSTASAIKRPGRKERVMEPETVNALSCHYSSALSRRSVILRYAPQARLEG